jgi:hypothetical protein
VRRVLVRLVLGPPAGGVGVPDAGQIAALLQTFLFTKEPLLRAITAAVNEAANISRPSSNPA